MIAPKGIFPSEVGPLAVGPVAPSYAEPHGPWFRGPEAAYTSPPLFSLASLVLSCCACPGPIAGSLVAICGRRDVSVGHTYRQDISCMLGFRVVNPICVDTGSDKFYGRHPRSCRVRQIPPPPSGSGGCLQSCKPVVVVWFVFDRK